VAIGALLQVATVQDLDSARAALALDHPPDGLLGVAISTRR
jgi:hypothetical protein